jgi:LacI family transcriptional regulator
MARLTLTGIAKRAGVSPATVSRVLNDHPNVREEKRLRVLQIIEESGYQPNFAARSLATNRTGIIGLVIPNSVHTLFSDPYFPRLTEGIAQACNEHDYMLSLFLFHTEEVERKLIPRITRKGFVDGIIIQSTGLDDSVLSEVVEGEVPYVVAGRPLRSPEASYVDVDNVAGANEATTHLIQLGYKRIATITGALNTAAGMDRLEGYRTALLDHGIQFDESLVAEGDFTEESGYYSTKRLLVYDPDAIFVATDTMALGVMRALREEGITVPEDIALVGYDDLPPARNAVPPLTTVRQPVSRFGVKVVETLLDIIQNGAQLPRRIVFSTELVIRESCGMNASTRV